MSKTPKSKKSAQPGVRNSRATVSGPARVASPDSTRDPLADKFAGTQDLAAAMPHNPIKSAEFEPAAV